MNTAGPPDDRVLGAEPTRVALRTTDWGPSAGFAFVAVTLVAGTQGGYFPTTWGPAVLGCTALVAVWLIAGARTDAGRLDLALITALTALAAWIGLSAIWSVAPSHSLLELQRALVVLTAVSALLVSARAGAGRHIAAATVLAITGVGGYGLGTRLFPDGTDFDPVSGYRLSNPVGYWNGLGILMAVGSILALGIVLDRRFRWARPMAAASLVILLTTLYFTFSRGGWLAVGLGLVVLFAVSPHRLAALGGIALVAPFPVLAVAVSSQSTALTHETAELSEAQSAGHQLAVVVVALSLLAAATALLLPLLERRIVLSKSSRRVVGAAATLLVVLALLAGLVRIGGPIDAGRRGLDSFRTTATPSTEVDLNDHLFQFSGSYRAEHWSVAWSAYKAHPVLGTGAGSFERFWQAYPDAPLKVRDAHSLYLEVLMELGPLGLLILLSLIGLVIGAGVAGRHEPIVPASLAAFVAYAVHAGVDWDWELTGVTMAAFFAAATCVIALRSARVRRVRFVAPMAVATGLVLLGAAAGYLGNRSLAQAQDALARGDADGALVAADRAHTWEPWSPYPLTVRGEALLATNDVPGAASAFRSAIDKDSRYWRAWLGLAVASDGSQREAALEHAEKLYPTSSEIYQTVQLLKREEERAKDSSAPTP